MNINKIINQENATIIDVREPYEFTSGHAEGAINIPLGSLAMRMREIKEMTTPIVVYCRSGMRSGQAMVFLHSQGVKEVYNGGSLAAVVSCQRTVQGRF